jgi:hypothetical protein
VTVVVNVVVDPEVTVTVVPPSPVADKITAHPCDTGTAESAADPPADVGVAVRVPCVPADAALSPATAAGRAPVDGAAEPVGCAPPECCRPDPDPEVLVVGAVVHVPAVMPSPTR